MRKLVFSVVFMTLCVSSAFSQVGVGTTTPTAILDVVAPASSPASITKLFNVAGSAIPNAISVDLAGNVGIGRVPSVKLDVDGQVKAASTLYTSDARLKNNIVPVQDALSTITKLRAVEYDKKQSLEATDYKYHEMGFIAQELQQVLPQLVQEGSDANKTLSVNYTALIPLLVKALQEQQLTLQAQQAEINQLKAQLK